MFKAVGIYIRPNVGRMWYDCSMSGACIPADSPSSVAESGELGAALIQLSCTNQERGKQHNVVKIGTYYSVRCTDMQGACQSYKAYSHG